MLNWIYHRTSRRPHSHYCFVNWITKKMTLSIRSLCAVALSSLILNALVQAAPDQKDVLQQHDHQHAVHEKRVAKGPPLMGGRPLHHRAITTPPVSVYTYITPSPGATPVAVTTESQIVTSYVPQFTLCELPPIAFFSASAISRTSTSPAFQNYSISIPTDTGTCTTIFDPTITMVCATTLTALDRQYTVTNCNDDITFSSEYGYVLATPTASGPTNVPASVTPAPTVETLTTYFLAPWQQLTAGTAPSEVDLKVCRSFTNGSIECIREYQVWETSLVTRTATTVTSINISTTVHGASQIIIETFVANVTETLTTFSMSTTMDLEFETEYTTTNSMNRTSTIVQSTEMPFYETYTLERVSSAAPASSAAVPDSSGIVPPSPVASAAGSERTTSTVHITSTLIAGTSTVTVEAEVPETK